MARGFLIAALVSLLFAGGASAQSVSTGGPALQINVFGRRLLTDWRRSPMRLDAITGRVLQQGRLIGLFRTVRRRAATTATRNQLRSVVQCVCVENALTLRAS